MYKTFTCGELRAAHIGQTVNLAGWVHRQRDHGGVTFIDLRDRFGLVQIVGNPDINPGAKVLQDARAEWVLQVNGTVRRRPEGAENPNLPTGEIEIDVHTCEVLNPAKPLPFMVNKDEDVDENVRLKYRYLDLRRERMQRNLLLRHKVIKFMRDFLDQKDFIEVETPILFKTTPEGARDYLVPSRIHPGLFYALPQSPQQLKQLLMVSGVERYFQIARCFRDEDLRGDRQPEFTQLDVEMSFVHRDDVLDLVEELFTAMLPAVAPQKHLLFSPWPRLSYDEVIDRFGSDKPDLRFGMELYQASDIFAHSNFMVFQNTLKAGGVIKCLVAPACAEYTRGEVDNLTTYAKEFGAKGLATLALTAEGVRGTAQKFITPADVEALQARTGAATGDLILFVADQKAVFNKTLGGLRLLFRDRLNLVDKDTMAFAWIVVFPMFEWNAEAERWDAAHHPFTWPRPHTYEEMIADPAAVLSDAYDLVCNGWEIASGSIRIHDPQVQSDIFRILGYDPADAKAKFGHMMEAFSYGAPPHGGMAPGIDRLLAILADEANIREVIAFPKTSQATDLMADAPAEVPDQLLRDLHIRIDNES